MEWMPIIAVLLFGLIGYFIGKPKGRGGDALLVSLLLGPLGLLIAAFLKPIGDKCPYCGGLLNKGAICCCHCGREVVQRRIPKVSCPMCGVAIVRSTLHKGTNECPRCGEKFEVE